MKWFKHDSDANMDAKLQEILLDYGLEGYGLFWYCLELITNKVTSENITFELEHDARIIARNTGSTVQKVEEMMKKMVSLGLFENNNGIITCMKLAERLDKSMTNSVPMRKFIDGMRKNSNVMTLSENVSPEEEGEVEQNNNISQSKPDHNNYVLIKNIYNQVIDEHNPNWSKCHSMTDKRKRNAKKAIEVVKDRANELNVKPAEYLGNLLAAMANDEFYSGKPTSRNPTGWRCDFELNLRPDRIATAMDKLVN